MSIPYDPEHVTYFAETDYRNEKKRFGIKARDRTRHMYVIGKSGVGKSTLLENMAIQDIQRGEGIAVLDPHGSFADKMLEYVPEYRIKDVVYFAPFDTEHPISFNVLEDVGADRRHLVVSGLISTFKKIWVDAWSARMEYILTNTLLALLEYPGATLLGVNRMLSDKVFRKKVVENITDSAVKAFWTDEFANYTERMAAEAVPAIQNKIGQFTANPLVRNIIGQPKSSFDIRKVMDEQKILIINLSKGRIGDTNTSLLGSMIITKIYLAAMSRAEVSSSRMGALPNFYFYVDEFQSFANETFADILAEARKYKLALIIAHQYVAQMEEKVRDAVFGNVGTTVSFRVGPLDAELLEKVFSPQFMANDLINLGMAQIYLTLMINDIGSQPFSARTLPPLVRPTITYRNDVIEQSRLSYAQSKESVETATREWFALDAQAPEEKVKKGPAQQYAPKGASAPYQPRAAVPQPTYSKPEARTPGQGTERPPERHHPFQQALKKVEIVQPAPAPKPQPEVAPTPAPISDDAIVEQSPGLKTLLGALDFTDNPATETHKKAEPASVTFKQSFEKAAQQVPEKKVEPHQQKTQITVRRSNAPFEGEKSLQETMQPQPVKLAERGPSEKNRDLLRAALGNALGDVVKKSQPAAPQPAPHPAPAAVSTPPTPPPAPQPGHDIKKITDTAPGEIAPQDLKKIFE
jgi:hypothetical protein